MIGSFFTQYLTVLTFSLLWIFFVIEIKTCHCRNDQRMWNKQTTWMDSIRKKCNSPPFCVKCGETYIRNWVLLNISIWLHHSLIFNQIAKSINNFCEKKNIFISITHALIWCIPFYHFVLLLRNKKILTFAAHKLINKFIAHSICTTTTKEP